MPDLSMLVLKRRKIWSNDSPSRGSTCISGPSPWQMLAALPPVRGWFGGIHAGRPATAPGKLPDRLRRATARGRGRAPPDVARRRRERPTRDGHLRQGRPYLRVAPLANLFWIRVDAAVGAALSTCFCRL